MKVMEIKNKTNKRTHNDEILVFVDGELKEKPSIISLSEGNHKIKIQQFHIYDGWYFIFISLFTVIDLVINTVDAGFLLRRWGKSAIISFDIDIHSDIIFEVTMRRKRKNIFSDEYEFEINEDICTNIKRSNVLPLRVIIGVIFFWVLLIFTFTVLILLLIN